MRSLVTIKYMARIKMNKDQEIKAQRSREYKPVTLTFQSLLQGHSHLAWVTLLLNHLYKFPCNS